MTVKPTKVAPVWWMYTSRTLTKTMPVKSNIFGILSVEITAPIAGSLTNYALSTEIVAKSAQDVTQISQSSTKVPLHNFTPYFC